MNTSVIGLNVTKMDRNEGKMTGLLEGCCRNKGFPYFGHNTFSRGIVIVTFAR